jgi:hypothetical protein
MEAHNQLLIWLASGLGLGDNNPVLFLEVMTYTVLTQAQSIP